MKIFVQAFRAVVVKNLIKLKTRKLTVHLLSSRRYQSKSSQNTEKEYSFPSKVYYVVSALVPKLKKDLARFYFCCSSFKMMVVAGARVTGMSNNYYLFYSYYIIGCLSGYSNYAWSGRWAHGAETEGTCNTNPNKSRALLNDKKPNKIFYCTIIWRYFFLILCEECTSR